MLDRVDDWLDSLYVSCLLRKSELGGKDERSNTLIYFWKSHDGVVPTLDFNL